MPFSNATMEGVKKRGLRSYVSEPKRGRRKWTGYTGDELEGFAADLGYHERPFPCDDPRRLRLQSVLDAIFARMYRLERADLEWILDFRSPGTSFPSLKQHELKRFGEYRTQRYVLDAFDQLERGEVPDLTTRTPAI